MEIANYKPVSATLKPRLYTTGLRLNRLGHIVMWFTESGFQSVLGTLTQLP